jgi:hypothetical protein
MKQALIIIIFFCFSFICKGQVKKVGIDTSLNYFNSTVIYIVDGAPVRKVTVTPEDIFSKDVLKGEQLAALYVNKRLDTVTVIITKKAAIGYYQKKLSAFSREYETYLKDHNGKDDDIQYVVHNDPLEKREVINFLYKLPPEKIIGVTFTERPALNGTVTQKVVIIETKVGE